MTESPVEKKPWSLKKKLLVWVGLPLMVLLAVALVLDGFCQGKLNAAMREARAGGGPVTFEELQAARKVWPDEQNGALIIVALRPQLDVLSKGPTSLPAFEAGDPAPLGYKLTPEKLRVAQAELKRLQPELTAIDRLLQFQGGRFPLTVPPNPIDTLLPDLSRVRASAKLKCDQALWRVMEEDTNRLVDDVTIMQRHGQLLADEPTLISALVAVACDNLLLDTIERTFGLTTLSRDQLVQLDALLAGIEGQDRVSWGLRGERAMFIGTMEFLRKQGTAGSGAGELGIPRGVGRIPGLRGVLMQDEAAGLRLQNQLVAASKDPRKASRISKEIDQQIAATPVYQPLTRILLPSLSRALDLSLRQEASVRAARVGLAVERYRLDTGEFPPSLEALTPKYLKQVPSDPFDDKPLRYRVDAQGVVIYSVGEDLTDDGGQVNHRVKPSKISDFGFILLPPAQRGLPATQPASAPEERERFLAPAGPG